MNDVWEAWLVGVVHGLVMDDGGVDGFNEASVIKSGRGRGQGRMDGWMDGGVIGALALPAVQSLRTNQRSTVSDQVGWQFVLRCVGLRVLSCLWLVAWL